VTLLLGARRSLGKWGTDVEDLINIIFRKLKSGLDIHTGRNHEIVRNKPAQNGGSYVGKNNRRIAVGSKSAGVQEKGDSRTWVFTTIHPLKAGINLIITGYEGLC